MDKEQRRQEMERKREERRKEREVQRLKREARKVVAIQEGELIPEIGKEKEKGNQPTEGGPKTLRQFLKADCNLNS